MTTAPSRPDLDLLRKDYLTAQLRGDRQEAAKIVLRDGLDKGISARELAELVIGAAQREIGELWQRNELSIAGEHMATAISNLVLSQLYERSQRAPANGKRIVVACIEGERHELPARLVADALDGAGYAVRFLGADVPTKSLLETLAASVPDMLALSATLSLHAPLLREAVASVRARHPGLPIAVGGGAVTWTDEVEADVVASSVDELLEAARKLLSVDPG